MWRIAALGPHHELGAFESGEASLDRWLREQARRSQDQGITRTYVATPLDAATLVGYYSIQPTQVAATEVSRSLSGGNTVVPGYLLARLALDRSIQRAGSGGQLLRTALETIVLAAARGGGRLIVVDPLTPRARDFYLHFDFRPTRADHRLVMKVATARAALGLGG